MRTTSGRTGTSDAGSASGAEAALEAKALALRSLVADLGSTIVAYSGGVDSAYLAWVAHDVLGDRALAVTAVSESYPRRHYDLACTVAARAGFRHEIVHTREIERPEYRANPTDRCYYCKQELYTELGRLARERGIATILDGNNADDRGDHRPGRQAAREAGVRSPLDEVALGKAEIRELARLAGLEVWDEPASACLSSLIPYVEPVTPEKLRSIEQAETVLRGLGFRVCRVRHHGEVARVELGRAEMARALEPAVAEAIVAGVKAAGFRYVALDLQGYRLGSLNERIPLRPV
jgi:uncharacterized protein